MRAIRKARNLDELVVALQRYDGRVIGGVRFLCDRPHTWVACGEEWYRAGEGRIASEMLAAVDKFEELTKCPRRKHA